MPEDIYLLGGTVAMKLKNYQREMMMREFSL